MTNQQTKTYRGSCACGSVKFEADVDLRQGTGKCNCTSCWKRRWWTVRVAEAGFRLLSGADDLANAKPGAEQSFGGFCRHCGVSTFARVAAAEWNDGAYVSVNVAALDDLDPADLIAAPVNYMDGRANNWWSPPSETRHL